MACGRRILPQIKYRVQVPTSFPEPMRRDLANRVGDRGEKQQHELLACSSLENAAAELSSTRRLNACPPHAGAETSLGRKVGCHALNPKGDENE